jgi:prepilin-type N-terminal cleavage/methylation domain-containing protein
MVNRKLGYAFRNDKTDGFSLIELMVVVGIIGVISAIGLPMYQGYVTNARESVMRDSIQSMRLLQEERRMTEGEYVEGTYDPADPDATGGLKAVLGWAPRSSQDVITYVVVCVTDGTSPECARGSGYTVTATHADGGDDVVLDF